MLYADCKAKGSVPTREGFAEVCKDQGLAEFVLNMEKDPFKPSHKVAIAVCVAVAALLVVCVIATIDTSTEKGEVSVTVECPGWDKDTSTPIVLSIYEGDVKEQLLSTDENATIPDTLATMEVTAGKETVIESITKAGTYTLSINGSPILEDGTIFSLPEPEVVEYDGKDTVTAKLELTVLKAEDVTEADLAAAEAAASTTGYDASNAISNTRNTASAAQGGTVKQGTQSAQTKAATSSTSSNTNSTSSSSGSNSTSHTHNWVAQTKTVHHDAVYNTVHHNAVTRQASVCNYCGADITGSAAAHIEAHALAGEEPASYREDTIVVTAAYDEQVLVSAAYDETVTTGYKCSTCGATK